MLLFLRKVTFRSYTCCSYVLKLFRDYVFHSVDEIGNPVIDLTHVLAHLNKVCPASSNNALWSDV